MPGAHRTLSKRELEVLEIASLGSTNAQIAQKLDLTTHTVKFHLASIYRKLGAANRTDAIVRFLRSTEQATNQARMADGRNDVSKTGE